jgi:ethanolamine utilization cobalamin adenosyltransferase
MRPELRATAQCLLPARNVVDEKTLHLKIITQHGGESRLVFNQQEPRPVEVRFADIPHAEEPITQINEIVKPVFLPD